MFDLTGSGFANKTGWISSGDALLVWDRNNDNRINTPGEKLGLKFTPPVITISNSISLYIHKHTS